jgi:hypothetical protein
MKVEWITICNQFSTTKQGLEIGFRNAKLENLTPGEALFICNLKLNQESKNFFDPGPLLFGSTPP